MGPVDQVALCDGAFCLSIFPTGVVLLWWLLDAWLVVGIDREVLLLLARRHHRHRHWECAVICAAAADRIRPLLCVCVCMLLMAGRWVPVIVVLCVGGVLSWSPPLLGGCLG